MTHRRPVVRHAPGKLFIAGEYAVVQPGTTAILVAVDRQVGVTVAGGGSGDVTATSDLCPQGARLRRTRDGLTAYDADDEQRARTSLAHVVSAVDVMDSLLTERGLTPPALRISVSSGLHTGGTKYGLGSSGAVTVATIAAVTDYCGLDLTPEARFRLAMLATAGLDAKSSGGDLAASTWGGWIAYEAPDRVAVLELARRHGIEEAMRAPWPGFGLRRLPPPRGLALEVGWTGEPVSTGSLVARLDTGDREDGAGYRDFLTRSTAVVRACVQALERADHRELLHQIRCARQVLARLDDETGLGIFTDKLTVLCDAAEAVGGAAKPSGAGGGDCGIALLDAGAQTDISQMRARWAAADVVPLELRPADERNVRDER
jgi:phosphomevalonate kinase